VDQSSDGNSVVVDAARLRDGGFIVIHDSTLFDNNTVGSVVGASTYFEPGLYQNQSIDVPVDESGTYVAMLHLDTNGNQQFDFVTSNGTDDIPYAVDGEIVLDQAEVTLEDGNETATPAPGNETATPEGG